MATGNQIIRRAGSLSGTLDPGEMWKAAEGNDALDSLNAMLHSWAARGLAIYVQTRENFSLVPGTAIYTIGSGGDFDTGRPLKLINAFIRSGGYDYPVRRIGQREYDGISSKTTSGRPDRIMMMTGHPLASLFLYPVPEAADAIHLVTEKVATEVTAIAEAVYPTTYDETLIYNLAVRLASEYGLAVSQAVAAIAHFSLESAINNNLANNMQEAEINVTAVARSSGDTIFTG